MDGRRPPPETSNFYCLPGRAGGTPMGIVGEGAGAVIQIGHKTLMFEVLSAITMPSPSRC